MKVEITGPNFKTTVEFEIKLVIPVIPMELSEENLKKRFLKILREAQQTQKVIN